MRVRGGHEEGGVDFETPGAALDWAGGGQFGEVAVFSWVVRRGAEYGVDLVWLTDPWKTPSFLCSLGLGRGFLLAAAQFSCLRSSRERSR